MSQPKSESNKKAKKRNILFSVGIILLLLLVIGGYYVYDYYYSPPPKENPYAQIGFRIEKMTDNNFLVSITHGSARPTNDISIVIMEPDTNRIVIKKYFRELIYGQDPDMVLNSGNDGDVSLDAGDSLLLKTKENGTLNPHIQPGFILRFYKNEWPLSKPVALP